MTHTITLIGCGKMGQAIATGLLDANANPPHPYHLHLVDPHPDATQTLLNARDARHLPEPCAQAFADTAQACKHADLIVLAVKPHLIASVLTEIAPLDPRLIVSVAAGLEHATLTRSAPSHTLVRAMPNTPALVRAGVTVLHDPGTLSEPQRDLITDVFSALGLVEWTPHEHLMHAVTALSGSGPAFVALFIEALADAAVACGMPRDMAYRLARHTVRGTADLLEHVHPGALKDGVGSPAGTTMAGVVAAEREGLRYAAISAVQAAHQRSLEMAAQSSQKP